MNQWRRLRRFLGILRRLRPRHLLLTPIGCLLALDAWPMSRARRSAWVATAIRPLDWGHGTSIVIPERGGGEMLAQCLASLEIARRQVVEPTEVIVIVNGSPQSDYAELAARYPDLRWQFHAAPLGFTRAVLHGLDDVRHGAVYLLNNDMILAPNALSALMPVRAAHVFGIASQIDFEPGRRREETGWARMQIDAGLPNPYHAPPGGEVLRGTVWAGAGSALFQTGLLRKLLPASLVFDPFYWEDVDLGVRAWRLGYDSLVCPSSRVIHKHRVTVKRYYAATEVHRVFERNRVQWHLRNPMPDSFRRALLQRMMMLDARTLRELVSLSSLAALWRARRDARHAPCRDLDHDAMATQVSRPPSGRECILMVSPFALFPARHGGAVRSLQMAQSLSAQYDVILLSDEREIYPDCAPLIDAPFSAVHLVSGRPELPTAQRPDRVLRMRSHAHRALRSELRRIVETRRPLAVIVEHMELGDLIDVPTLHRPAWLLSLHDVLLRPDAPDQRHADEYELACMRRYEGRIVSSREDQQLLGTLPSILVGNGVDTEVAATYLDSAGKRSILFVGPFRASINLEGIVAFLQIVYPELLASVDGVTLTIVGGTGSHVHAARHACFGHPSITLLEHVEDMPALIRAHAVTINPQASLRGSSLKVIESLAAGRVCVSTEVGARGRIDAGFSGLLIVPDLSGFTAVLRNVLVDEIYRLSIEPPQVDKLRRCSWPSECEGLQRYVDGAIASRTLQTAAAAPI